MRSRDNKKGFTLAELLIVVAIIGVLVAIAIPVFNNQLEKSREATDLANVRAAYAEVMASTITEEELTNSNITKAVDEVNNAIYYQTTVKLHQKVGGWQSSLPITIAGVQSESTVDGISPDESLWTGKPKANGTCTIKCFIDGTASFNWSQVITYLNINEVTFEGGSWDGSNQNKIYSNRKDRIRTASIVKLKPNTTYTLTYEIPDSISDENLNDYVVQMGTLFYNNDTGTGKVSNAKNTLPNNGADYITQLDSGWALVTSSSNRTITRKFTTNEKDLYFAANLRILKNGKDQTLLNESQEGNIARATLNTLRIEER